jgi:hypothetical protein
MKFVLALLIAQTAVAAPALQKKSLPVKKEEKVVKNDKMAKILEEKEDCDEKAKKPVEIVPESISLTGNAGCSLDEAH